MSNSSQKQASKKVKVFSGEYVSLRDYLTQRVHLVNQKDLVVQLQKQLYTFEKELTKSQSGHDHKELSNLRNKVKYLTKQISGFEEAANMSDTILDHDAEMIRLLRTQVNLMTDTLTYIVRRSSDGYAINAAAKVLDICEASKGD
jgi:uncharacterized Fe-S cluster-containing radical SAM superfamily protein